MWTCYKERRHVTASSFMELESFQCPRRPVGLEKVPYSWRYIDHQTGFETWGDFMELSSVRIFESLATENAPARPGSQTFEISLKFCTKV